MDRLTDSGKRREKYKAKDTEEQTSEEHGLFLQLQPLGSRCGLKKGLCVMFHKSPLRQEGAAPCVAWESSARVPESEDNLS